MFLTSIYDCPAPYLASEDKHTLTRERRKDWHLGQYSSTMKAMIKQPLISHYNWEYKDSNNKFKRIDAEIQFQSRRRFKDENFTFDKIKQKSNNNLTGNTLESAKKEMQCCKRNGLQEMCRTWR